LSRDVHDGAPFVHGEDGMGNVVLGEFEVEESVELQTNSTEEETAAEFLVRQSFLADPLHVISLGPMTNLALAQKV
jgi:inosine-uridine nucleoside N-ribohydrolase